MPPHKISREEAARGNLPDGGGIGVACIQQQFTFWRRNLWERAAARLDAQYNLAADSSSGPRFYQHAELYGIAIPLASFDSRRVRKLGFTRNSMRNSARQFLGDITENVEKLANWYRRRLKW